MAYYYSIFTSNISQSLTVLRAGRSVKLLMLALVITSTAGTLRAEGTKQLAPNPDEIVMLLIDNDTYGNFAAYDGPEQSRLYFRIDDPNEVVYLGLSRNFRANGQPESTGSYNFRIRRRSDGAVVHGPFTIHAFNENVSNWADATLGPAAITGQGYETSDERFFFDPSEAGDYFIEFENASHIGFWDISVAGNGALKTGRVYSTNWAFRTPADQNEAPECVWDREFNGILYSYTSDGFVTKIDFSNSGFQGLSFNVAFNRTGPGNSGDPQQDRMSVEGENLTENSAEHLIFLNEPDPTQFPDGECGAAAVAESFLCTDDGGYCLEATVTQPGQVEIVLDFNQNGVFDNGLDIRLLEVFEDPDESTRCIEWDGLRGDGTRPTNGETVNLLVQYTQGVQHWALFDGEFLKNGFCVEPVRPSCDNDQSNLLYWDDRNISDEPGTDSVKDGRLGCDCATESCRTWNYFDPNTDDCRFINDNITLGYGDKSTLNTWWFARNLFTTYVNVPFPEAVTIEGESEICENETTTLTAVTAGSEIVSITWEGPDGIISQGGPENTQITVAATGTYTATVEEASGCSTVVSHELTVIVCPVDVELDKLVDVLNPEIGQIVNYEIVLTNKGPGPASGIRVEDNIPDGLTDITAISDGGTLQADVIVWNDLALAKEETIVLRYRARVTLGQSYTNLAEVMDMDQEDLDSSPGNGVDTNGNGEVADDPGDEDDGDGVVLEPQACSMNASISNVICDDNGTPVDPSDDTFSFEVIINASNASTGWVAGDAIATSGDYGQTVQFGPYPISGGTVSFQVQDQFFGNSCSIPISVNPPETCSDQCLIETEVTNLLCNDNGTPSDPDDDTYTFDLTVTGFNTGESWSAGDVAAAYGQTVSFGPIAISDGATSLTIVDGVDNGCITEVIIQAPASCSGQCAIEAVITDVVCDDNGTPSHPEDDVFFFNILVEGANVSADGWTTGLGLEGTYGEVLRAGPFPISEGDLSIEFRDKEEADCTAEVLVTAPATCSDECLIEAELNNIRCDDNGTLSDPGDDIFYFDLLVTGLNVGNGWEASTGTSGDYGSSTTFGPFAISDGPFDLVISDDTDADCTIVLNVTPPATCSNVCSIEAAIEAIYCDDNGTASNPNDDVYYADILVSGANTSEQGFTIGEVAGEYNVSLTVGPFPIAEGDLSLDIIDAADPECSTSVSLVAPETCSEECELFLEVLDVVCDDNGTPSISEDDLFSFMVIVTGFNTSGNWQSTEGVTGNYGEPTTLGPFPINAGTANTTITDLGDTGCTVPVSVEAPPACSDVCQIISAGLQDLLCDDNGTPIDPTDDTYTFTLNVSGYNLSEAGWSSNLGIEGDYNTDISFGPFPINEGGQNIIITDNADPDCQISIEVPAPETCSDQCAIEANILEIVCLDNGTPSHADDDLFEVQVIVMPINNPGSGWIGSGGVRGNYGDVVTFGPYPIRDGNRRLIFNSLDFVDCRFELPVTAPEPCSDLCLIEEVEVLSVVCDDNNTPNDSQDDFYTYTLMVNGLNLSEDGWTASDGTTGNYGVPTTSVAHPVSDGEITVTITDNADEACQYTITVTPPPITIECPEDAFQARVNRNALILEGELEEEDARFAKADSLCWLPSELFEAGDHYYDQYTLRYNSNEEAPEVFTFYLFSAIPGNQDLTLGLDGAGGLFLGPYYPDDPCCYLQSSDVRATPSELATLLENPELDPAGLFSQAYDAVAKFSVLMAPNEDYTLITTTFLEETEGNYAWLIVSDTGVELEVVNGDIDIEDRREIEVGMELTFFDRQYVLNNPESTDALGFPQVNSYCGVDSITFDDQVTDLGECNDLTINRKFKVYGYGSTTALDSCEQELTLRRPDLDDIILPPEAILYACDSEYDTLANGLPAPSAAGFPLVLTTSGYAELSESFNYNLTIAYKDNLTDIPGDFTQTFNRDWTITDVCNDTLLRYTQLIKIGGFTDPIVECPISNHYCPILEGNIMLFPLDPFACTATVEAPLPDIINTCGEQVWMVRTEVLQVVGTDTLVLATFEPGEERIIADLPPADYLFRYTVFDDEDHVVEKICVFRVADTQEPSAICRSDIEYVIAADGLQRIGVEEINQGSYDNCEVASVEIRRVYERDPETCELLAEPIYSDWGAFVSFSCCDIDQEVTVEMRVTDIYGIENMCWLDIPVKDQNNPSLSGLEARTVSCSDLPDGFIATDSLQLQAVFGLPQVVSNCPSRVIELSPLVQLTECGSGTIQRRFQIMRMNGLLLEDIYTQMINIGEYLEYEIGFPADAITNCMDLSDTLILRKTACDSLEVTYEDELLDPLGDECYRVARTYHVISHCEWNGISEAVVISRDEDCNATAGEDRIWVLRRPDQAFVDQDTNENNSQPAAGTKGIDCDGDTNPEGYWRTAESTGYWVYTQEVRVYDESDPQITFVEPAPFCTEDKRCEAPVSYPFTVDDACVVESLASLTIGLDVNADGTVDEDLTNAGVLFGAYPDYEITGDFPIGSHQFLITATDVCGNSAAANLPFTVVDCFVATPTCEIGLTVNLAPLAPGIDINGDGATDVAGVTVTAADLITYDPAECSEPLRFSLNRIGETPDINRTSIGFTCDDRYTDTLEIYIWDSAFNPYRLQADSATLGGPNYEHCRLEIRIEDPNEVCPDCDGSPVVGGTVSTEEGETLPVVDIDIGQGDIEMPTDQRGGFRIENLPAGERYTVTPHWDEGHRNGVSTLDLLLARAHILGLNQLDSPYKLIAADVNNSGTITTLDLLEMRQVLLGEADRFIHNTSWRFVDRNYVFPNAANPWQEPFPESVEIEALVTCIEGLDFAAIKVGDLNGSARFETNAYAGNRGLGAPLILEAEDQVLEAGASVIWPLALNLSPEILGFQFTLSFDPELVDVEQFVPGLLSQDQAGMRHVKTGAISFSWDRHPGDEAIDQSRMQAFGLKISAKQRIRLSEVFRINSRITEAEAYPSLEETVGVNLQFEGAAAAAGGLKLYQNRPNPFGDHTVIAFELPESGTTEVQVMDVSGRTVWRLRGDFAAGYNEVKLMADDLPGSGLFYYMLRTPAGTRTKKLIVF